MGYVTCILYVKRKFRLTIFLTWVGLFPLPPYPTCNAPINVNPVGGGGGGSAGKGWGFENLGNEKSIKSVKKALSPGEKI